MVLPRLKETKFIVPEQRKLDPAEAPKTRRAGFDGEANRDQHSSTM